MANGLNSIIKREIDCKPRGDSTKMGSRRIFTPQFKLQVLDSYRQDSECKGNQRATARKYGIHRRQIQKWLQVENNLRTTVDKGMGGGNAGKGVCERHVTLDSGRQSDAGLSAYTIVPAPVALAIPSSDRDSWKPVSPRCSPVRVANVPVSSESQHALDFSTQVEDRPIDLSLKKQVHSTSPRTEPDVTSIPVFHDEMCPRVPDTYLTPEVWDLSPVCRKRKYECWSPEPCVSYTNSHCHSQQAEVSSSSEAVLGSAALALHTCATGPNPPKAVKLFKPYLLDSEREALAETTERAEIGSPDKMASLSSGNSSPVIDVMLTPEHAYQWRTCDPYGGGYYHHYAHYYPPGWISPPPLEHPLLSLSLSVSSTDSPSPVECLSSYTQASSRQRQSYTLGFKLSAIDSYYKDNECRGNQRAVAHKFNIHRRQVQKWLKQEDVLRQRGQVPVS